MYNFFEKEGVDHCQLQITFPMGNALKHENNQIIVILSNYIQM